MKSKANFRVRIFVFRTQLFVITSTRVVLLDPYIDMFATRKRANNLVIIVGNETVYYILITFSKFPLVKTYTHKYSKIKKINDVDVKNI